MNADLSDGQRGRWWVYLDEVWTAERMWGCCGMSALHLLRVSFSPIYLKMFLHVCVMWGSMC